MQADGIKHGGGIMKKRRMFFVCAVILCIMLSACASKEAELPEMVKAVQHKIDKALESEPTYADLLEIQDDYDELLKSEQELVKNYDRIEKMISEADASASSDDSLQYSIAAVNMLKKYLKHPDTLDIRKLEYGERTNEGVNVVHFVHIEFAAENEVGGNRIDEAMYSVTINVYGLDGEDGRISIKNEKSGYASDEVLLKYADFIQDVDVDSVLNRL